MIDSRPHGSIFAVVMIILTVAIIGMLSLVFWHNITQSKDVARPTDSALLANSAQHLDVKAKGVPNEGYLVLDDWGIKFKLPEDAGEVLAYKETISNQYGTFESYNLTTKRVEGLGQQCVPDASGEVIRLSGISRRTVKQEQYSSAFPANNNEPLNGYYYYVSGGQSVCSEEHTDWQSTDNIMTSELLSHPEELK